MVAHPGHKGLHRLPKPQAQDGMLEIGDRFVWRGNRIELRGGASSKPCELGVDEPHPVALLPALAKLGESNIEHAILSVDEPLQIVGVAHPTIMGPAVAGRKS